MCFRLTFSRYLGPGNSTWALDLAGTAPCGPAAVSARHPSPVEREYGRLQNNGNYLEEARWSASSFASAAST